MKTQPSIIRELKNGKWEHEFPSNGKKTVCDSLDKAMNFVCTLRTVKIKHYNKKFNIGSFLHKN